MLIHGDCLEELKKLPDDSVDSLVTDPPAGIGFMGKEWDHHKGGRKEWCAWMESIMRECLRVMKPGAHGLVWALPRTSHWTATALEDAGFEIRDVVLHLFGQGFPKSLDISKAIDRANKDERPVIGKRKETVPDFSDEQFTEQGSMMQTHKKAPRKEIAITSAASAASAAWEGWGTALKPASEHWILVRKPISEKTVAANVLKWGTGALNIDGSRIGTNAGWSYPNGPGGRKINGGQYGTGGVGVPRTEPCQSTQGRFPSHLLLSHSPHCTETQCDIECAIAMLDEQSGVLKPAGNKDQLSRFKKTTGGSFSDSYKNQVSLPSGSGGASRFFYCAKISASERNVGLEGMPEKDNEWAEGTNHGIMSNWCVKCSKREDSCACETPEFERRKNKTSPNKNNHPTVKPQKLMRHLARLVTPPGGTVLDPFMGSGSTGLAAKSEGFGFVGIEREQEYLTIAEARIGR